MTNITINIDDKLLFSAKKYATEQNSAIGSLVRDFLAEIATRENNIQKARIKIKELSLNSTARIGSITWTRDELHER